MKKQLVTLFAICLAVSFWACKTEYPPENALLAEDAVKTAADVQNILNGAYSAMRENCLGGRIQILAEVMGDNIDGLPGRLDNADYLAYYNKTTGYFTGYTQNMYGNPFRAINRANTAIAYAGSVPGFSDADRKRVEGEARFIRAVCHFEVVRLFAQPYGYTPDNSHLGITVRTRFDDILTSRNRNTVKEVYDQILADLNFASANLPETNGNYATSWAAKAYLAKVYFQMNNFQKAAAYADSVIASGKYTLDNDLMNRFSKNISPESIFSLISTDNNNKASDEFGDYRSDLANDQNPTLKFNRTIYNLSTADPNDKRGKMWYKLKGSGANELILIKRFDGDYINVALTHLTEMHLIRAEAAAEVAKTSIPANALASLNAIRNRAGLANYDATGKSVKEFIEEVRLQRRLDMVGEGTRFHDLRRICMLDRTTTIRGAKCDCDGMAVQFPDGEISGAGGPKFFTPNPEGNCY